MRRNVASQIVGAQMVSATDGSAFTGTVSCVVTKDGGTQTAGGGTVTHEGNGFHSYTVQQTESDAAHVAFTFTGTGAVPATVQVYPNRFPDVAPGAAGGLFIAGTNAPVTITNTDGHALTLNGGTNGHGLLAQGAGTGSGLVGSGGSSGGHGVYAAGDNSGMGIYAVGGDAALALTAGLFLTSQASSNPVGLYVEDGAIITDDAGTALQITATGGNGDGVEIAAHGTGIDIDAPQAFGIVASGVAQSASATGLVLAAPSAFADNTLIGATVQVYGSDQGYWQTRVITDNALSGDSITVDAWDVTPSGTITYKIYGTPPASATAVPAVNVVQVGGSTTDVSALATNVAAILVDTGTTLDTKLNTIDDFLDTEVAAIKAKTDSLTFTQAGQVDANIQSVNDVALTGNGAGTPWGPA